MHLDNRHLSTCPNEKPCSSRKHRPPRLEPLNLTVTEAAKVLGVTRQALNNVVNEKAGISPEMAIRLSRAFGSTPETWVRMQATSDLARALRHQEQDPCPALQA